MPKFGDHLQSVRIPQKKKILLHEIATQQIVIDSYVISWNEIYHDIWDINCLSLKHTDIAISVSIMSHI